MKKVLTTLFILALTGTMAFGQVQADATVSANVLATLTVGTVTNVDFGNISATSTPILDATGASHTDVGGAAVVGEIPITGSDGAAVSVVFSTASLSDGASGSMTFTPSVYGEADGVQASAAEVTSGNNVTLGSAGYTFFIGGNLGTLSEQTTGSYTGTFSLTLEYY